MAKKRGRKTNISKVTIIERKIETKPEKKKKLSNKQIQELMIENFAGLQKAMTNLAIKFEGLAEQHTKLLNIFELAAKNYLVGDNEEKRKDVVEKIDKLLEQNKLIAEGIVLLEEQARLPKMQEFSMPSYEKPNPNAPPKPQFRPQRF